MLFLVFMNNFVVLLLGHFGKRQKRKWLAQGSFLSVSR